MELCSVLENVVELSALTSSNLPNIPEHAKEFLSSIAILEIKASDLEEEMISLQCQLSQKKKRAKTRGVPSKTFIFTVTLSTVPCHDNIRRLHSYSPSSRCLELPLIRRVYGVFWFEECI
ncbi:hypothetical protein MKX01_013897 [Papaver californicum]|nr:hypothetical protein MKX01_013897 [Papaver californicum]